MESDIFTSNVAPIIRPEHSFCVRKARNSVGIQRLFLWIAYINIYQKNEKKVNLTKNPLSHNVSPLIFSLHIIKFGFFCTIDFQDS